MEELALKQPELIGREPELDKLKQSLENANKEKGSTIIISGEAGIGKTRIVQSLVEKAEQKGFIVLSAVASKGSMQPFLAISLALSRFSDSPIFQDEEYSSFAEIFAVNNAGMLMAKSSSTEEEGMDPDIFAGMLTAVQNFVKDSFDGQSPKNSSKKGLGRLEYGNLKILIEHSQNYFLAAVFQGNEHPDMLNTIRKGVEKIDSQHSALLQNWDGSHDAIAPIEKITNDISSTRFLVRRDLSGIKLESERLRIADSTLEMIKEYSEKSPILMVLEDLHWADESSLYVISYLARNIEKRKIMIVGTTRPLESQTLDKFLKGARDADAINDINLCDLTARDVELIISQMFPNNNLTRDFAENIASRCTGNPFFIIETLKQMKEEGSIAQSDGCYSLLNEEYSIPSTVEDLVFTRLEKLEPDALAYVEYASCIGMEFSKEVFTGMSFMESSQGALLTLENSGILIISNGTVRFNHGLFQDTIYKSIGTRWKSLYHRSAGEYFEIAYEDKLDDVLYDLARHFSNSNEYNKSLTYSIRAGEKAENAFAPEQANEFYKISLNSMKKISSQHSEQAAEINYRLGTLNSLTGDFEPAIAYLTDAIGLESDEVRRARYYKELSFIYDKSGNFQKSIEVCQLSLDELGDRQIMEGAMLLNHLGWAHMRIAKYKEALELSLRGLAIAENINNKDVIAESHSHLGPIYWHLGDQMAALEHLKKSLDIRNEIGDIRGASTCHNNMANVYMHKGDLDEALECNLKSLEIKQKIKEKAGIAVSLNNLGNVYLKKNMLDKALEYYLESLKIKEMIGDPHGVAMTFNNIGILYKSLGEYEKSIEHHKKSLELRRKIQDKNGISSSLTNIGHTYIEMGEYKQSIKYLEEGLRGCIEINDKRTSIETLSNLTNAYTGLGDNDIALDYAKKALDASIELKEKSKELYSRTALAKIYRIKGKLDKSKEEYDKILDIIEEFGEALDQDKIYYEMGLLFIDRNEPDSAREHLEKAISMFKKNDMEEWALKCEKVLENLN